MYSTEEQEQIMYARITTIVMVFVMALGLFSASPVAAQVTYSATYYVSASGNDGNTGSQASPFASLSRTASVINGSGTGGNYLVIVMTDLTATAGTRYYDNNVTITSLDPAHPVTITRGTPFATQADTRRGVYNPAMLEIDTATPGTTPGGTLTLTGITFDDNYTHESSVTVFSYTPAPYPAGKTGINYPQDSIVAAYTGTNTIVLGDGAALENFGGMTAVYVSGGATAVMMNGSLITDVGATESTRTDGGTPPYAANPAGTGAAVLYSAYGDAAVFLAGGHVNMQKGSSITNIANVYGIKAVTSGGSKIYVDGTISGMIGANGLDAAAGVGTGIKSAVYINDGTATVDFPNASDDLAAINVTAVPTGAAIIGPDAQIINNEVKSGAVELRAGWLHVYGKINNNTNLPGGTLAVPDSTNGAGMFIIGYATAWLEDGSEICDNKVIGSNGYGGAVSVQQQGAKLIMNGGTISGNTATIAPGIAVNKTYANFIMNGGTIDNGPNAIELLYHSLTTYGTVTLNGGTVSGATVQANTASTSVLGGSVGQPYPQYNNAHSWEYLYVGPAVTITGGYITVNSRQVYLASADLYTGNPNIMTPLLGGVNNYTAIRAALPLGWTMPADMATIGFWMRKNGTAEFSVPMPAAGYDNTVPYFAAVQGTLASGATDTASPVSFYPTQIVGGRIVVTIPLGAYTNGATVALVQPTTIYGTLGFSTAPALNYVPGATDYTIPYTGTYRLPIGLYGELTADGNTNTNTSIALIIRPDARTMCANPGLTVNSDIFELKTGTPPAWNSATGELSVSLQLKSGWDTVTPGSGSTTIDSTFDFSCTMASANFQDGVVLRLTGEMILMDRVTNHEYDIYSNWSPTEMLLPTVTVTFDGNGGTVQPADAQRQVKLGATLGSTMPGDPVRSQYTFMGWNTRVNGQGTAFTNATQVTGGLTVYAQWKALPSAGATARPIPALNPAALALLALLLGGSSVLALRKTRR